jgi:hypothetical protein
VPFVTGALALFVAYGHWRVALLGTLALAALSDVPSRGSQRSRCKTVHYRWVAFIGVCLRIPIAGESASLRVPRVKLKKMEPRDAESLFQICFDMFRDHAMPYIHMKDFVSRKSPIYASIPYQDRSSIVRALAGTARRHLPLGILVRINANEYESETTPRFRSQIGSHYTVASIAAVMIVGVLLQQGDIDWSVSWTFEGGHVSKVN